MHLQSPDKIHRSVSYCQELLEMFRKAQESKSPIKLTGVKRKLNYLDHTKEYIEINNTTKLQKLIMPRSLFNIIGLNLNNQRNFRHKKNDGKVSLIA